jgi:hypothetical protein
LFEGAHDCRIEHLPRLEPEFETGRTNSGEIRAPSQQAETRSRQIARELRQFVGNRLRETPTTVQIPADDLLEIAMQRGGVEKPPIVPYEAAAGCHAVVAKLRHADGAFCSGYHRARPIC